MTNTYTQDITQCFYNSGAYKLESLAIVEAEKEAAKELKAEVDKWRNYKLAKKGS